MHNIIQQFQIEQNRRALEHARNDAAEARDRVSRFDGRTGHLALAMQAMWSLLKDRYGLTDADLIRRMHELDAADGVVDGRVTATAADCPACGRKINSRNKTCIYCGATNPTYTPFVDPT